MSDTLSGFWQQIVTCALVGTQRQAPTLPPAGGSLGGLIARLDTADPEAALLGAAAALALYRRAGQRPERSTQPMPEPCPAESLPRCSVRAWHQLALMLEGQHTGLLHEWLSLAARAGQRAPEATLPDLLELGRDASELREAALPVLGERGRWLAGLNPRWSYVRLDDVDESVWQTGSRDERRAFLQQMRQRDPARARELVESTWSEETPDDRARFLAAFQSGLSMEDEAFLEAALDDRRKEVRRTAADLLARLPESRLSLRTQERVRPLLALKQARTFLSLKRDAAKVVIEVTLPEACDKAMIRDGVEPKPPPGQGVGERAWWFVQMLGVLPPGLWSREWRLSPSECRQAARAGEWRGLLRTGWAAGAERHRDVEWAAVLVADWEETSDPFLDRLAAVIPHDRLEALLLPRLDANGRRLIGSSPGHEAFSILRRMAHPWSESLSRTLLQSLRQEVPLRSADYQATWSAREWLRQAASCMHPSLAPEAATGWRTDVPGWDQWEKPVNDFVAALQFRHEMHKEFE